MAQNLRKPTAVADTTPVKPKRTKTQTADPNDLYSFIMNEVDDRLNSSDTMDDMDFQSSGSLAYDMIIGGGILPAMYTNFGPEQSAKTTMTLLTLSQALQDNLPIIAFRDAEGSTRNSVPYLLNILQTNNNKAYTRDYLFGKKDEEGTWIQRGRIRYSSITLGTSFFNWFAALLNRLPDKVKIGNTWYLMFEPTKANMTKYGSMIAPEMRHRKDGIYIQSPDGGRLAGIVIIDSWPNLQPKTKDTDTEDDSLAAQARMFAKNFPRVKGMLVTKKIALFGVNQLRDVPMAMFGPKEREPGGQALRFNSDCRVRMYPRAIGDAIPFNPVKSKKAGFELEPSIDEGEGLYDRYRYIHIRSIKNKLGPAEREGWLRIWTKDHLGQAHGIDPVFDTIWYLRETGQLRGNRKAFHLNIEGLGEAKVTLNWADLKLWILGTKREMMDISTECGYKPFSLRKYCFAQMKSGVAERLYNKHGGREH